MIRILGACLRLYLSHSFHILQSCGGSAEPQFGGNQVGTVLLVAAHFTRTMRGLHKKCFPPYRPWNAVALPQTICTGPAGCQTLGHWHCFHWLARLQFKPCSLYTTWSSFIQRVSQPEQLQPIYMVPFSRESNFTLLRNQREGWVKIQDEDPLKILLLHIFLRLVTLGCYTCHILPRQIAYFMLDS